VSARTASAHQAAAGGLQPASVQPRHPVAVAFARMGCEMPPTGLRPAVIPGGPCRQLGSANEDGRSGGKAVSRVSGEVIRRTLQPRRRLPASFGDAGGRLQTRRDSSEPDRRDAPFATAAG
jgi:hypothetical protein